MIRSYTTITLLVTTLVALLLFSFGQNVFGPLSGKAAAMAGISALLFSQIIVFFLLLSGWRFLASILLGVAITGFGLLFEPPTLRLIGLLSWLMGFGILKFMGSADRKEDSQAA